MSNNNFIVDRQADKQPVKQKPTKEVTFLKNGTIKFNGKTTNDYEWLVLILDPKKYNWT